MEATLIMLDKPILVNEEIKLSFYVEYNETRKKILAGHEGTKRLTFNLSDEDAKRIGYFDVKSIELLSAKERDSINHRAYVCSGEEEENIFDTGFFQGFRKCESLTPKKYTEEQARAFFDAGTIFGCNPDSENNDTKEFESIKSKLDQPQQYQVECTETENGFEITKIL